MECIKCGECCKRLSLTDRLLISLSVGSLLISKKCKFLVNNLCTIHERKPKTCRDWVCGVKYLKRKEVDDIQ